MKKYLFFILSICLSVGIYVSDKVVSFSNLRIVFFSIIIFLFVIVFNPLKKYAIIPFLIITIFLGFYIHQTYQKIDCKLLNNDAEVYFLKIIYQRNITEKSVNYVAKDLKSKELISLNVRDKQNIFHPYDEIIVYGKINEIQEPLNPNQFNFKQFLTRKNIHYQLFTNNIISLHKEGNGFRNWASKSKLQVREKLKRDGYSLESRALISSMLLGDRTELTPELNQSYIATGVVHILSISGLHVMMIYMILNFVLQPLLRLKNGRKIRIILSLCCIWLFSFYVELEPPVFRSALMISIYYISELLNRPKNIYHTLSLSAFIILVFQPNYLFDVGFQLSFSAVFFIVWLNPIFDKMWKVKNKWLKDIKGTIDTSLSAQIGTLPIAVYYFNQFSGLFLFGNLILIPASFLMICGGILSIIFLIFNINIPLYTWVFNQFIHWSNSYIYWLASFKFVAEDIYMSIFTAVMLVIILYFLNPLFIKKSKVALLIITICTCFIEIDCSSQAYQLNHSNELIVFNQYKNSILSIRNGRKLAVFSAFPLDEKTYNYTIKPYKVKNRIKDIQLYTYQDEFKHPSFIKHKNYIETKNFDFMLDEEDIHHQAYYQLIHQSKIYSINNTDNQLKFIIVDASNYPSTISQLEQNLPNKILWKTSEKGYFSIQY
ncbi:ComEC/Rec2 family competence protein [Chishuiella sp.]|uniref:ComEC/Rec2 family competence protein n=1 Tax=Chishuiella sp. TaxID=1969467 RepID=UPI0028AF5B8E|nr:ComEC/Rec2 family competence protein [Chishuiella sp.]